MARSDRAGPALKVPYADAPSTRGLKITSDTQLRNMMSRAALDKFQVAVHAIGDEANAAVLTAIEDMAATYTGDRRWRIEHAQVLGPADIARLGKHGIIASMQPAHQTSDRVMAEARLGPARLAGPMPGNRFRRAARSWPSVRTPRSSRPIPSSAFPPRSAVRTPRASRSAAGNRRSG
jgi:predicted amidohydrolase YtcJ